MIAIKDNKGNEYHAKLRVSNLDLIQNATGLQIDEIFSDDDPIVQLLLSPRKLWKVVDALVGHRVRDLIKPTDEPLDITELFDINDVFEWLEKLIADFHPRANSSRISSLFATLRESPEEAIQRHLTKREALNAVMQNPELIGNLMNNPRALEALVSGSVASSASTPVPTASEKSSG